MSLVIPLFSGIVGAFLVFCLGVLRERWRREQELEGLLRLVDKEIQHNELSGLPELAVKSGADFDAREPARALRIDTWQQARAKIAELLLNRERFSTLADYYLNVQTLNNLLDPHASPIQRRESIPGIVSLLDKQGTDIRHWIESDYIGDHLPTWKILRRYTGWDVVSK
jgi:hypothetical protein